MRGGVSEGGEAPGHKIRETQPEAGQVNSQKIHECQLDIMRDNTGFVI